MSIDTTTVASDLLLFTERGLLGNHDAAQVLEMLSPAFPFTEAMSLAESVHVHVSVDDVDAVLDQAVLAAAAAEATGNEAERKFAFSSGLNVILASLPTAQDELIPGAETRPKPYVDHLGVDLRDANEVTDAVFERIPAIARSTGWRHVYQDGPLRCCHVEMGPKHWIYPPEGTAGTRRPIEFALGDLATSEEFLGCDYRPIDPAHPLAALAPELAGCGDPEPGSNLPHKIHVFEECSCNTSPSLRLLERLRGRYGEQVEVRSFDLAKPEGLLPLPPALFAELQSTGFGVLPALVVDGKVRTLGWLPEPDDAPRLVEAPPGPEPLRRRLAEASPCCADGDCC